MARRTRMSPFQRSITLGLFAIAAVTSACGRSTAPLASENASEAIVYTGMCDASAAVALDARHFAVANDEDNRLRVYQRGVPGLPIDTIPLTRFLDLQSKSPETDIEGAAQLDDLIFWITSHGRNKDGKPRPNRQRFFATRLATNGSTVTLVTTGKPYPSLLEDLVQAPQLRQFQLANAAKLSPKEPGALNIEGLAATPDGRLLIGFRNPVPDRKALIVPLNNPAQLLEGGNAELGDPILLDLGGLGIREMTYHDGWYLIVAGSYDGSGRSQLFSWRGPGHPVQPIAFHLGHFNAEAVVLHPSRGWEDALLLSDDGSLLKGRKPCKDLKRDEQKSFRALRIDLAHWLGDLP